MFCDNYTPMVCSWRLVSDNDIDGEKLKTLMRALLGLDEWDIKVLGFSVSLEGFAYGNGGGKICRRISTAYIENMIRIKPIEPDENEANGNIPGDIIWVITMDGRGYYIALDCCNYEMRRIIEENEMCEAEDDMCEADAYKTGSDSLCGIVEDDSLYREAESELVSISQAAMSIIN